MNKLEINKIGKEIFSSRSKDKVKEILNSISLTSGSLEGGLVSGFVGSNFYDINEFWEALNKTKFSKIIYTTAEFDDANVWTKASSNLYYQVVIQDYKWSEGVNELPEGAVDSGTKTNTHLRAADYQKWYHDDNPKYYQVIAKTIVWGEGSATVPGTVSGIKLDSALIEANVGKYYLDYSAVKKTVESLTVTPQSLNTTLIYKKQQIAQEDIDDLNESGEYGEFINFVTNELKNSVETFIVGNILGGELSENNDYLDSYLYRFTIDGVSDVFTTTIEKTQTSSSDYSYVTIDNLMDLSKSVKKHQTKWLVIHPEDLQGLFNLSYSGTGIYNFISKSNLADILDVDYIYSTPLIERGKVICLDPSEYWVRIKREIEISYPVYDLNGLSFQYELNVGSKIHAPLSSAMLVGSLMTY